MRLLLISNVYPDKHKPYAGKYILLHKYYLELKGVKCHILSPEDNRQGRWRSFWKYFRMLPAVFRETMVSDFDVIHAHWIIPSGLLGLLISRLCKKPLVLTSHGAFVDGLDQRGWLFRSLIPYIIRQADAVIAVGENHRKMISRISGLPSDAIYKINMGVRLKNIPVSRRLAREELSLSPQKKIVIFLGNLYFRKGADVLLKAVNRLEPDPEELLVILAGQGPEEMALRGLSKELGLEAVLRMVGPVLSENVMTWLAAADLCVIPSRTESFGLVAIEAMAAGTTIVASNIGGLKETIRDGENGILFPVDDDESLSEKLQVLIEDDQLRSRIEESARSTIGNYDMSSQVDKVLAVYSSLIG